MTASLSKELSDGNFSRPDARRIGNGRLQNCKARRMMTRRTLMGFGVAAGGTLGLSGCLFPSWTYRYRLTLDVDVNGVVKSGSGIIESRIRDISKLPLSASAIEVHTKGEAVAVDVGGKGVLFALLAARTKDGAPAGSALSVQTIFERAGLLPRDMKFEDKQSQIERSRARVELLPAEIPFLVRFGDIADPKSVARVDPNDLAASFGPGVKLVRATIEITDDPVTAGIEKRLGWYQDLLQRKASLDGDTNIARFINAPLANRLGTGSFRTGF